MSASPPSAPERILFVTGRLAENALRHLLAGLGPQAGFDYEVAVLGISVAALMHSEWVARKLHIEGRFDRVILPGWCQGDLAPLSERFQTPFERGPKDLYDLPQIFGRGRREPPALTEYSIEILAEINHAPRLTDEQILMEATFLRDAGADVIDLGCVPGESWEGCGDIVRLLRDHGLRVSIDSFERREVEAAVAAGAELILSCNHSNLDWAPDLGAEVVAIPDDPRDFSSLEAVVDTLQNRGCRFRIDPVLEPIGFGFMESLRRYARARDLWPETPMLMGVGNITELSEADTSGMNLLLAAICEELRISSVLTTQVINWARTSVRELDVARRLVHHSLKTKTLPKHLDSRLVMLRDPALRERGAELLEDLARQIRDPNFRIFAERGEIHLINRDGYWRGDDPYAVFDAALAASSDSIDASHAFYLGYELAKAKLALVLGKQYTQDEPLRWGLIPSEEVSAIERRRSERHSRGDQA